MPARKPRQRIEIDTLFAPLPQELLLDGRISAPACRLWGVLYVFRWNGDPPDFDRLAAAMRTTDRSIYRWLQELETAGWIDWDRNAALADRFTLRTSPGGDEIDTSVNVRQAKLIPRSNKLTPGSEELIVGSEELTQVSIFGGFSGVSMPETDPTHKIQNHEKIQNVGVGAQAFATALVERGLNPATIEKLIARGLDPATVIQSLDNMLADGAAAGADLEQVRGRFVTRLRLAPPEKGKPYARQRPVQSESAPHQPKRSAARARRDAHAATSHIPADLAAPAWLDEADGGDGGVSSL